MSGAVPTRLSVVVASAAGGDFLARCLDSLAAQVEASGSELIVVDRRGEEWRAGLRRRWPAARVVAWTGPDRPSVPRLRALGVDHARGELVAVIEEHCAAPPGWIETILGSFAAGDTALGGPILDDGYPRLADWVVYFSEYHNDLPPWPAGEREWINDANAAYRRAALLAERAALDASYWAVALHPRLRAAGLRLRAVPEMAVCHTGPFPYGYYLRQRFWLSRLWGGTRRAGAGWAERAPRLLASPLLPAVLFLRIARRVAASGDRRLRLRFLACAPLLLPALTVLAAGEWLGWLLGPGRAAEVVE